MHVTEKVKKEIAELSLNYMKELMNSKVKLGWSNGFNLAHYMEGEKKEEVFSRKYLESIDGKVFLKELSDSVRTYLEPTNVEGLPVTVSLQQYLFAPYQAPERLLNYVYKFLDEDLEKCETLEAKYNVFDKYMGRFLELGEVEQYAAD